MNRIEFMEKLRLLLSDMEESEREEALAYYEEYFDDAGVENEQQVIEALGSPEKVARIIRAGLDDSDGREGVFSESGFRSYEEEQKNEVGMCPAQQKHPFSERLQGLSTGGIALLLILVICALPILGPLCIGVIGVIIGLFGAAAALIFVIAVLGIALMAAGAAVFLAAFPSMIVSPALGVLLLGISFLMIGIGIILTIFGIRIIWKLIPPIIRWIVKKLQGLFLGKER